MTEAEWLACDETATMMLFLGKRLSRRKKELFFAGISRLFWDEISDDCYRRYCEVKERHADGLASEEEMEAANQATAGRQPAFEGVVEREDTPARETAFLRHLTGNPFRAYPVPERWSMVAVELAQALYDGDDNRLVLADALEESNQRVLADHFRQEEWHPKGCWVLDLILGKT